MSISKTRTNSDILVVSFDETNLDDEATIQNISTQLLEITATESTRRLLLDMQNVEFLTSSMIGQMFALQGRCKEESIELKLCGVHGVVEKILGIVRLDDFVEIVDDVATAEGAFGRVDQDEFETNGSLDSIQKDADGGDVQAQYELANCYLHARGVPYDAAKAAKWLTVAAEQGHAEAQYRLGVAHAYGIHVDADYDAAVQWYRQSADQGNANAQYSMGMSYHYGIGVPQDHTAARQWYQKAAASGHEKAEHELNRLPTA